jgi:chemotaxis protein methyltransferase CheR
METSSFNIPTYDRFVMSQADFRRFKNYIYTECGINLVPAKKTMLTVRLSKRLRALGIPSFNQYFDYVSSPKGRSDELVHMIDVVTTNKTDFFREPGHFDFLVEKVLPEFFQYGQKTVSRSIKVWSAGCSTGEEPYTLAMVMADFFSKAGHGKFSILATDISTRVLETAQQGIYPESFVDPVPVPLKHKYLMRGKGPQKGYCRIVPELRNRISFQRFNLIEGRNFGLKTQMDIIFCRNVIIYFDRETQIRLFEKFFEQLSAGGYLFIGHSESLHGINDRFIPEGRTAYRKPEES